MNPNRIKSIRRAYIIFSIILGVISPLLCYWLIPHFNIENDPLSKFGISTQTSDIWFLSLLFISIGLWLNGEYRIEEMIKKEKWRPLLQWMLRISTFSLLLMALIDMSWHWTHKIVALLFFCGYNLFVFAFGIVRSLTYVRRGMFSVIMATLMLSTSLLILPFPSYGIAEISYIFLIVLWNTKILFRKKL